MMAGLVLAIEAEFIPYKVDHPLYLTCTILFFLIVEINQRSVLSPDSGLGSGIKRVKVDAAIVVLVSTSMHKLAVAQVDLGKVVPAVSDFLNSILRYLIFRDVLELISFVKSMNMVSVMNLQTDQGASC